jgi:hypothetical protein
MRSQGSSNARDLKHVEVFESRLPLLVFVRRGPDVLQRSVQSGSDLLSDRPLGVDGCGYGGIASRFSLWTTLMR